MGRFLLVIILSLLLCVACNAQDKYKNNVEENGIALKQEKSGYSFEEFQVEFKASFDVYETPLGTYFWNEFGDHESQYNLTDNESKLLGNWINITYIVGPSYNNYSFHPNKFFISLLKYRNFQLIENEKIFFNKAIGTWEIVNEVVRITIYAIVTEDSAKDWRDNKGLFFVDNPYTIDFININDIGEEGFTKRPINDKILSEELQRLVTVKEQNKSNNLYVRNIYMIDHMPKRIGNDKDYGYYKIVPDLARENLTGLELATNRELIEKYIFPLWP